MLFSVALVLFYKMKFCSHAKWIMAGEHTVVRGGKALAFPLHNLSLNLEWVPASSLEICDISLDLAETFLQLLRSASDFCGIDFGKILGKFSVRSNIPMKSGLGSSAALCLNLARLFEYFGFCSQDAITQLAVHIENILHGKSSGLDIAVAASGKGVVFEHNRIQKFIDSFSSPDSVSFIDSVDFTDSTAPFAKNHTYHPRIVLSYSGEQSSTAKCAALVQDLIQKDPKKAADLDFLMNDGANLCESGLINDCFDDLKKGINSCNEAFRGWGLYNSALEHHAQLLFNAGAVAVKPIGSGLGGFMLSLWDAPSPIANSLHSKDPRNTK